MTFHVGETVVHWSHGLGEVVGVNERGLTGEDKKYYVVKAHGLSVWVPNDEKLDQRLRAPTPAARFGKLFAILKGPAVELPEDRRERQLLLRKHFEDGKAEALCRVIRDLTTYEQKRPLNEVDKMTLRRAEAALREEWSHVLSVPPAEVQVELHRLLKGQPS